MAWLCTRVRARWAHRWAVGLEADREGELSGAGPDGAQRGCWDCRPRAFVQRLGSRRWAKAGSVVYTCLPDLCCGRHRTPLRSHRELSWTHTAWQPADVTCGCWTPGLGALGDANPQDVSQDLGKDDEEKRPKETHGNIHQQELKATLPWKKQKIQTD